MKRREVDVDKDTKTVEGCFLVLRQVISGDRRIHRSKIENNSMIQVAFLYVDNECLSSDEVKSLEESHDKLGLKWFNR
ncbi:CLUMA_CG016890, isoform A [Clunio marinus]|uniref:CLUMA_CG016890, isoform A n=1 Tax=Clunio marinus TaxID=568069 RepID=A0A1J1IT36_9DIPT|nr:CLUMA_CG016890, isoform A [Clunio marinus]